MEEKEDEKKTHPRKACVECGGELLWGLGALGIDSVWVCENSKIFRRHCRKIPKEIYDKYLRHQIEGFYYEKMHPLPETI